MFQTVEGFLKTWEHEEKVTQRILDTLTDESLTQRITSLDRTLGRIAWHLVTSMKVLMGRTGLDFIAPPETEHVPPSAKELAKSYRETCQNFVQAIKEQWQDDTLSMKSDMYGEEMPNSIFLMILIRHQIHHRGQMTVLMRQAGLKVPGIYGPSREEWAGMGMEAPLV
ncbi:DinB family protein [Pseudalkalibacillus caeni]|uniref:Damage-inducible protein DinB n=1 Tax=Exobacillus caeni TaxID=2574798 RepID=A0A5R9EZ08_9BACL|nr:DinB family protein [Pseudalkalibacillus caeni]TLS35679.1 hypothetical protein FCL54_19465 [Pseudalkalibacillus caeni]